jgi:hypothetical protein
MQHIFGGHPDWCDVGTADGSEPVERVSAVHPVCHRMVPEIALDASYNGVPVGGSFGLGRGHVLGFKKLNLKRNRRIHIFRPARTQACKNVAALNHASARLRLKSVDIELPARIGLVGPLVPEFEQIVVRTDRAHARTHHGSYDVIYAVGCVSIDARQGSGIPTQAIEIAE